MNLEEKKPNATTLKELALLFCGAAHWSISGIHLHLHLTRRSRGAEQDVFLLRSRTRVRFIPALLLYSQAALLAALSGLWGIL